jgi:GNAT superfamily N-acetyltransferase
MAPIRHAVPADADAIGALHVRGWQSAYRGLLPDALLDGLSIPAWVEKRRNALTTPWNALVLNHVVEGPAGVLGWASTGPARDAGLDAARVGEVYAIYLEPSAVGRGHGRELLAHALERLAAQGFGEVVLWVLEHNARARRFYECAGFALDTTAAPKPVPFQGRILDASEVRYRRPLP